MRRIVAFSKRDELTVGTNCRFLQMRRIVAFSKRDELTVGTNCRFLEFGTNCRPTRKIYACLKFIRVCCVAAAAATLADCVFVSDDEQLVEQALGLDETRDNHGNGVGGQLL